MLVLIFVEMTLEVRRAFHGSILVSGIVDGEFREAGETSNAEWYAYSVAWLVYAGVLLALGIRRVSTALRYASLALVMLTTAKLFVFDMSELTGLFRVASFLGLGPLAHRPRVPVPALRLPAEDAGTDGPALSEPTDRQGRTASLSRPR